MGMVNTKDVETSTENALVLEEIDLRRYWKLIYNNKWKVILCALVFGAVAAVVVLVPKPSYEATATISFDTGQANLIDIKQVYESGSRNEEYLQTQVELLKSRMIIEGVIDKLDLTRHPDFIAGIELDKLTADKVSMRDRLYALLESRSSADEKIDIEQFDTVDVFAEPDLYMEDAAPVAEEEIAQNASAQDPVVAADNQTSASPESTAQTTAAGDAPPMTLTELKQQQATRVLRDIVATKISKSLTVKQVSDTQLIAVTFSAGDPDLAALVANTVAGVYLESQDRAGSAVVARASDWLNQRLEGLRTNLEESEKKLNQFHLKENLVDMEGIRSLSAQELNETTTQLLQARKQLQEIASVRAELRQRDGGVNVLAALPQMQDNNVIQSIKAVEASALVKRDELSLRYGPKHPKMIAARSELETIRSKLRSESQQLVARVDSEYRAAQANVRALERQLDSVKQKYQGVSQKDTQHADLKRQVEIDRNLYSAFLTRLKEANETSGFDSEKARLADPALPPRQPVDNKLKLLVVLAMFAGAGFGIAFVLLRDMLDDAVRNPEDVEFSLQESLFGLIPMLPKIKDERQDLRIYFDPRQYRFAEAVRTLRTSLVLSQLEQPTKVIGVTSTAPGEGKTTVSESLAFALAQMESVLLIDADLRRSSVGKDFSLPSKHPGLTDLLTNSNSIEECIYHDHDTGLDIIPAGTTPPDALKVLGSPAFANTVKMLADRYDCIIIDTPPVHAVSDALLISRVVQTMLYVIKADSTGKRLVRKGLERFAQSGRPIDGVVLNQFDITSKANREGDYYTDIYGYGADAASADVSEAALVKKDAPEHA
ncbi:GumC family protein [Microbulbifer magnicolonia]|uniref:GumC family protein n=1 Tax=Microbulbifer magnicolonia TaxID=3109744 RepID=UPI002B4066D1|nr:polysaccharide biosynthesis tyrosine autokinase [Microbulbifer sp. GG15]